MDTIDYTVCRHFLTPIFYGDYSGLDDEDIEKLEAWMEAENFDLAEGHFSHDSEEETNFETCDIVGLSGDTVKVTWVIMNHDDPEDDEDDN